MITPILFMEIWSKILKLREKFYMANSLAISVGFSLDFISIDQFNYEF